MLKKKQLRMAAQASVNAYGGEYGKVKKIFDVKKTFRKKNVEGHFGYTKDCLYIVFEGSDGKRDWRDNFRFKKKTRYGRYIKVHRGFLSQFEIIQDLIYKEVDSILDSAVAPDKIIVCGHSLGGALATICSLALKLKYKKENVICVTFGSPRVGNHAFAKLFNKIIKESHRFVYGWDSVAGLPPAIMRYYHIERLKRLKIPWYDILLAPFLFCSGNPTDHYPQKYIEPNGYY